VPEAERPVVLRTPEFANLANLEFALSTVADGPVSVGSLYVDLSQTKWISPLSATTLTCWLFDRLQSAPSRSAHVTLPLPDSFAARLLSRTGFPRALRQIGASITGESSSDSGAADASIAAFERFQDPREKDRYIEALDIEATARSVLQAGATLPHFVQTRHFNAIALRELLDNTFVHARGVNSHFCAVESGPATSGARRSHSMIEPFAGAGYIEVAVADSWNGGIIRNLTRCIPSRDLGLVDAIAGIQRLTPDERRLVYALVLGASTRSQARLRTVAALIHDGDALSFAPRVKGLADVNALAAAYGGQVLVRTGQTVLSVSHAKADAGGAGRSVNVAKMRRVHGRPLVRLGGTIVTLRIPTGRSFLRTHVRRSSAPTTSTFAVATPDPAVMYPHSLGQSRRDVALELASLVDMCSERLRQLRQAPTPRLLVIILDGLVLESKVLGAFLAQIARLPKDNTGVAVLGSDERMPGLASREWEAQARALGAEALVLPDAVAVLGPYGRSLSTFGDTSASQATSVSNDFIVLPSRDTGVGAAWTARSARLARIKAEVQSPTVCSTPVGKAFLIDGLYYTRRFYRIRSLLQRASVRSSIAHWIAALILEGGLSALVTFAEGFATLADEVRSMVAAQGGRLDLVTLDRRRIEVSAMQYRMQHADARACVLYDVLCTGGTIQRFLALASPAAATIATIIDARQPARMVLSVPEVDRTRDYPVISAHQDEIEAIWDSPPDVLPSDIIIIDPVTHVELPRPSDSEVRLTPSQVISMAGSRAAIEAGHFVLDDRHYTFFFAFRALFDAMGEHIERWLNSHANAITGSLGGRALKVYCVDEGTGLALHAERAARAANLVPPQVVARSDLQSTGDYLQAVGGHRGTRASAQPRERGVAFWCILPALASGHTLQRALDMGRSLGADRIVVSCVLSRMSFSTRQFYLTVDGYGRARVQTHCMVSLPIRSYDKDSCPVCADQVELRSVLSRMSLGYQPLRDILQRFITAVEPVSVTSAGVEAPRASTSERELAFREAAVVVELEEAVGDVGKRKALLALLSNAATCDALVRAVGRGLVTPETESARITDVVYRLDSIRSRVDQDWIKDCPTVYAFRYMLRGFRILVRDEFKRSIPSVIRASMHRAELVEMLMIEAVLDSDCYWAGLRNADLHAEPETTAIARDYLEFVATGGDSSGVIHQLHELRWHLVRSSGWGHQLGFLRGSIDQAELRSAFERFRREGVHEGERRFLALKSSPWALEQLRDEECSLADAWRRALGCVQGLGAAIEKLPKDVGPESMVEVIRCLDLLEGATRAVIRIIGTIATRPTRIPVMAASVAQLGVGPERGLVLSVSDNCPSIAMHEKELMEVMQIIVENSEGMRSAGRAKMTRVVVDADRDMEHCVSLAVLDDGPRADGGTSVRGGLLRAKEICARWGAVFIDHVRDDFGTGLERRADTAERVRIRFHAWPIGK
jgi:hypothetical protein